MSGAAAITPEDLRVYAGLPSEVPGDLLARHIVVAVADLERDLGRPSPPAENQEKAFVEALTVRALASVFPWLNTFALQGAAKIGRLDGAIEYRFLSPEEMEDRCNTLMDRYAVLLGELLATDDEDAPGQVSTGGISMVAI